MRRFTLILALVLMVAMPMMAERVTPETARKVATTFLSNNGAKAAQLTDLSKAAGFSNLYIFTAEQGFVVMAADDCVQPILGYSLTGKFVAEDMPENVIWWLNGYNNQIQDAIENQTKATSIITKQWEGLVNGNTNTFKTRAEVGPLIKTEWDQTYPYNYYCPTCNNGGDGGHVFTGCVATAMAQVITYHEAPSHGTGSHGYTHNTYGYQYANFGETTYDWLNMPKKLNSSSSQAQINAVATLIYHCGVAVDMDYGADGSGAYSNYIAPALRNYFNYSETTTYVYRPNYTNTNWIALMRDELDNRRPIVYGGVDSETNPQSGHSFVCDGYGKDGYGNYYFNFNWGWSGYYNGYFSINNMTPGGTGAGGGNHNYSYLQDAVIGIKPISSSISAPTNFVAQLIQSEGGVYNVRLSWQAASGAVSYRIYRDNTIIATIAANSLSYLDENVSYGTHDYYIKSVDSNGDMSAASNTETITITFPGPVVTDLDASVTGNDITLLWTALNSETATLKYVEYNDCHYITSFGLSDEEFYWGVRFPASLLSNYAGMALTTVSNGFYNSDGTSATSDYYIYVVQSTGDTPSGTVLIGSKLSDAGPYWYDISVGSVYLDFTQDLWVIFKTENIGAHPVILSDTETENGNFYSFDGQSWSTIGLTWPISITITDGTYTYNLYRNGQVIASDLSETSYTDQNRNNAANYYTVTTNYFGGESAASNGVGYTLGTGTLPSLSLNPNDKMTVTAGSKLTVNGTLSNSVAANLVLENGAQLVNSSDGVQATVKKNISPYSQISEQNDGWNLIASPITESIEPTAANGLLTNSYDLYTFNQSEAAEWRNYEADPKPFTAISNKVGYLYASSDETTLTFTGTLANTATATALEYNGDARFKGFNLIGNPFPCEAYIDRSFYVLKEDGSDFTVGSNPIPPCAAILVQAQEANDNITFTKTASKNNPSIVAQLQTADIKGSNILDQARVNFKENDNLVKYSLDKNVSSLYFPQEGNEFAAVSFAGQSEMPLNFKVKRNGSYTLSFELENAEVDYLHLIDNMTGADIDLLTNKSYTFEANMNDYASRFRLVFSNCEDAVGDNETFAYINNGNIVVNQEGTLQIVDMTGRVVVSRDGRIQCVPTSGMTSGVYVLRLINGDNVKTQKIVVQ